MGDARFFGWLYLRNRAIYKYNFFVNTTPFKSQGDLREDLYTLLSRLAPKILRYDENVISIKKNIYINKNFVDKIKYDILVIKYDNRLNKLYILDENFINIYDFEKIDEDLEISNITVIENKLNFTNLPSL